MKIIKKIGHWIAFILGSYFGAFIYWGIMTLFPIFSVMWLMSLSNLWFIVLGSLCIGIFTLLAYGLSFFIALQVKLKPDYWVSNGFILLFAFYFFYTLITRWDLSVKVDLRLFTSSKGIIYAILIIPIYLRFCFMSLLLPFTQGIK